MKTSARQMSTRCLHCGSALVDRAPTCPNCGKRVEAPAAVAPNPPPVPVSPQAMPTWATVGQLLSAAPAGDNERSVVFALTPRRPATWAFWVGLVMSVGSLVFAICPLLLAVALALDPQSEDPAGFVGGGLLISGCVVVGLFVPGIILVFAGRPRRA